MPKLPELRHYLLDLDQLTCPEPASDYDEEQLNELADALLACGDTIAPIVVKMVSIEKYEVIDGFLTYHAAVLAQEKNSKFDKIGGYIVDSKNEEFVRSQSTLLSPKTSPIPAPSPSPTESTPSDSAQILVEKLDQKLDQQFLLLSQVLQQQSQNFVALQDAVLGRLIADAVEKELDRRGMVPPSSGGDAPKLPDKDVTDPIAPIKKKYTQGELEKMTIPQLKSVAQELDVPNRSKINTKNKNEYIGRIMARQDSEP